MPEYIDRERLIRQFESNGGYTVYGKSTVKAIVSRINAQPAVDVVEVVRCKDCKYFGKDLGYGKHDCKKYEMPYCLENDYCSYGERKNGVDNATD